MYFLCVVIRDDDNNCNYEECYRLNNFEEVRKVLCHLEPVCYWLYKCDESCRLH